MTTAQDHFYMGRALQLAMRGLYTTHPNPRVGCVLVKDGAIVGEGWHEYAGGPHAEINALAQAGTRARGATCYATLEPCCHQGRTPPCSNALIRAGVARVVAAMQDPNPKVGGEGLLALKEAGILVESGLFAAQTEQLNPGFIKRMKEGLPFVRAKVAMSLDGRTALASGESRWITSPEARLDGQRLRAQSSAIMTGIGTVLADDPSLTARLPERDPGLQPLRVVLDSQLRMPTSARLLGMPGHTWVLTTSAPEDAKKALLQSGAKIVKIDAANGRVDLRAALRHLAGIEVNEVLLEAGPALTGGMLDAGLVDELVIYLAPKLMGSGGYGVAELPGIQKMADCPTLAIVDVRPIGSDWRITAKIRQEK